MVDAPHFHVVFTLPGALRRLARFAPTRLCTLLFSCASATLLEFGQRHLKAKIGTTVTLHTWTKELRYHPHVHCIVTGGGFRPDGTWSAADQRFLFPLKAMSRVFRGKMRDALRREFQRGCFDQFDEFLDPEAFDRLHRELGKQNWHVYSKRSFGRARHVLAYLGRYTHRVALSNSKILAVTTNTVTIRTQKSGRATMAGDELVRRFALHVLPPRFHKIRHYGLYARRTTDAERRAALGPPQLPVPYLEHPADLDRSRRLDVSALRRHSVARTAPFGARAATMTDDTYSHIASQHRAAVRPSTSLSLRPAWTDLRAARSLAAALLDPRLRQVRSTGFPSFAPATRPPDPIQIRMSVLA